MPLTPPPVDRHGWPGPGAHTAAFGADATSQSRLQAALTASGTAAWHSDLLTRQRWWSQEMFSIHGLTGTDDVPEDYLALVHPEDCERVKAAFEHSMATGSHKVQYRVLWPDRSIHWIEGVGKTTFDGERRPLAITGACSLIDDRKQEESDLLFLTLASDELARTTDYEETLRRVARLAVPHFADWCAVDMLDGSGDLKRIAVAHVDPAKVRMAHDLHRRYPPDREAPSGTWNILREGVAELLSEIPDDLLAASAKDAEHLAIIRSLGLRSYMGVPIRGADGVLGVVTFISSESGRSYAQRDLNLARDLVARAAVAVQNAVLIKALRESDTRQKFLLALTDVLRLNTSMQETLTSVSNMLGAHFCVNRVGYGHVDESLDRIAYDVCWTDGTVVPLLGEFPASAFGPKVIDKLRAGETVAIPNVREHPLTAEQTTLRTSHEVDTRAILVVPLFKAGALRTIVYLNQREQRQWSSQEISLMEEVAERTRELIERGRVEIALRKSESRWRGLFESMAEAFFVGEAIRDEGGRMHDFRFLEVNPAFVKQTGVSATSALGAPVTEVIPGVQQELIDLYARIVDTGEPAEFEVMVPALHNHWYEARARRIAPDQFSVLFLDVTERKNAQQELTRAAARYQTLFETIDEGFCILELLSDGTGQACDYRFLEVNPAFERQSGLVDAAGKTIRELVPGIEPVYIETYDHVARTGQAVRFQSRAEALNRWFDAFAFRVGEPAQARVALLFTDITRRKESEDALREADARKDQFLATLAHELRNPLAPLRNGLAILRMAGGDDPTAIRARELMERQLGHLVRLVDDLLDVSRVSQGKVVLKPATVSVRSVVDLALETSRPVIDAAGHTLTLSIPSDTILLEVDSTRIAQVLSNLLNNAAKYTPRGGNIRLTAEPRSLGTVQISVEDDGVGIPADMLEKVFDLFTQVGSAVERSQGGLGIGLSLAKQLVELHGGHIRSWSAGENQGSTFTVELPVVSHGAAKVEEGGLAHVAAPTSLRVLVVDDNKDAAETLAMLLALDGHQVRVVHSGAHALRAAAEDKPDLAFLDIGLPDVNGYEVAVQLRRNPDLRNLRLIALTGWGAEGDLARSAASGIDLHLTKPVSREDLAGALATAGQGRSSDVPARISKRASTEAAD